MNKWIILWNKGKGLYGFFSFILRILTPPPPAIALVMSCFKAHKQFSIFYLNRGVIFCLFFYFFAKLIANEWKLKEWRMLGKYGEYNFIIYWLLRNLTYVERIQRLCVIEENFKILNWNSNFRDLSFYSGFWDLKFFIIRIFGFIIKIRIF